MLSLTTAHAEVPSSDLTPHTATDRAGSRASMVSIRVLRELVEAVEQAGVPRATFLRQIDITPARLEASDARLPRAELYRACELALDATGNPAFGLHWVTCLSERAFAPVSHLIAHAPSLRQGFEVLAQFSKLLADHVDYEIYELDDTIALRCLPLEGESARLQRTVAEMMVGGFFRLVRSFGLDARPAHVSFAHAAPSDVFAYARFFECEVRFDESFTGFVFDRVHLDASSPAKDDDVREALRIIAERRLLELTNDAPYTTRVRTFLVHEGWPHRTDMASTARALDMSVRSLRRRLDEEGASYGDLLNDAMAAIAKRLILDPRRTTQEIAYEMGFSDTSAFYRAFKRWTGTTPSACRGASRSTGERARGLIR